MKFILNVLKDLSAQELNLAMAEASSLSNVRIINEASSRKNFNQLIIFFLSFCIDYFFIYLIFTIRHFLGDKITNFDALIDFVG